MVSSFAFCRCNERQHAEGRICMFGLQVTVHHKEAGTETAGRNSGRNLEVELKQGWKECCLFLTQIHLPRDGAAHSGLLAPTSINKAVFP